jgi:subtilisin family serine protease
LIIARIFAGTTQQALYSTILEGIQWVAEQNASVINLSVGGGEFSNAANDFFERLRDEQNILVVAAAGNDGGPMVGYPASYESVLSVASVDESLRRSPFSNYNAYITLTAPGSGIVSTAPLGMDSIALLSVQQKAVSGAVMQDSLPLPTTVEEAIQGLLIECPEFGNATCPGPGGHICLIER